MSIAPTEVAAVVLAGGFGTRIRHLLKDVPKPMAPVDGRPFLEWVLRYLANQGIREAVLSTGHLADVVADHFHAGAVSGISVQCVQETTPLGTAGGFHHAAKSSRLNPAAWLVLNGDSLAFASLREALAPLDDPRTAGVIIGRMVPDASRYGTLNIGPKGELLAFQEKRSGSGVINSGIYLLRHSLLEEFPPSRPLSFEQDVFPSLIARGFRIQIVETSAPFLDIGTPESLPLAEAFIRDNAAEFAAGN